MAHPLAAPLAHRDFRLLWLGACTSLLGDGVYLVAIAWQAYTLTHRPSGLALLGLCATLPQLFALVAGGVISDRYDRRRILLVADLTRFLTVGVVAWLVAGGGAQMWHLAILSVVYGTGAGFAAPAFDAIVPSLVPPEELEQANALDQILRPTMLALVGPAVGGLLVAGVGAGLAFAVDAGTFAASAACLAFMRPPPGPVESRDDDEPATFVGEALAGLAFVRSRVWLWGTFGAATLAYLLFVGPTEVLLPYLVREELNASARDLGLILSAGGIGALGAAAVVGATGLPRRQLTFMYAMWALATFAVAGYGLAQARWQLAAAAVAVNGLEAAGTIAWATTKQRMVPAHLLGRVSSLDWFISIAGLPLSYAVTAPLAALFGARNTLVAAGVLGGAVTLAALYLPGMREADGATSPT